MKILVLVMALLAIVALSDAPVIHPDMQRAILENEARIEKGIPFTPEDEFAMVDGKKQPTGFHPTSQFYMNASFINFKSDPTLVLPEEFDLTELSYSPVRGQIQGSCWAEGNGSAFELTWNFITGRKDIFAVQDIIDCSGFGTAKNGGQLSMEYDVHEGLALEADYKYTGRDGRCKEDIARRQPFQSAPFLRGFDGRFPTERELMEAAYKYGALEVCGSASALGSGGRQDTPRNGSTNHCYAYAGWKSGKKRGWLEAYYHVIKNSWGAKSSPANLNLSGGEWGDDGRGQYRLSRDGVKLLGSVITEIQVANTGRPLRPVEPIIFTIENDDLIQTVTVYPGAKFVAADLKAQLEAGLKGKK